jgi:hypothetical protein
MSDRGEAQNQKEQRAPNAQVVFASADDVSRGERLDGREHKPSHSSDNKP